MFVLGVPSVKNANVYIELCKTQDKDNIVDFWQSSTVRSEIVSDYQEHL